MSTPKATRIRPDEQFARLLELSPNSSSAAVMDPAMNSMTALANALRVAGTATPAATPDPAFRAALRQRLVAVAAVRAAEPVTTHTRAGALLAARTRAHHRLAALAGTFALVTSMAGVGVAAARSLPGDPFYGVKRATEAVQLWTARGEVAKGEKHLEFARTRLAEAKKLSPNSSHLASTLAAMDAETKSGSTDLIKAYATSKSPAPLADLVIFSRQQVADLSKLTAVLPRAAKQAEQTSVTLLSGVLAQVHTVSHNICVVCAVTGTHKAPTNGHQGPPIVRPSSSPSAHPTSKPTKNHPRGKPSATPTNPTPRHTPTSIIPTQLLPTGLPTLPIPLLSTLLHPHHHKPSTPTSPKPLISSLLGDLGL